jgi:hypothetical protein
MPQLPSGLFTAHRPKFRFRKIVPRSHRRHGRQADSQTDMGYGRNPVCLASLSSRRLAALVGAKAIAIRMQTFCYQIH